MSHTPEWHGWQAKCIAWSAEKECSNPMTAARETAPRLRGEETVSLLQRLGSSLCHAVLCPFSHLSVPISSAGHRVANQETHPVSPGQWCLTMCTFLICRKGVFSPPRRSKVNKRAWVGEYTTSAIVHGKGPSAHPNKALALPLGARPLNHLPSQQGPGPPWQVTGNPRRKALMLPAALGNPRGLHGL